MRNLIWKARGRNPNPKSPRGASIRFDSRPGRDLGVSDFDSKSKSRNPKSKLFRVEILKNRKSDFDSTSTWVGNISTWDGINSDLSRNENEIGNPISTRVRPESKCIRPESESIPTRLRPEAGGIPTPEFALRWKTSTRDSRDSLRNL